MSDDKQTNTVVQSGGCQMPVTNTIHQADIHWVPHLNGIRGGAYGNGDNTKRPGWTPVGLVALVLGALAVLLLAVFLPIYGGWISDSEELAVQVGEASLARDVELTGQLNSLRQGTEEGLGALWQDQKRQDALIQGNGMDIQGLKTGLEKVRRTSGWNASRISKAQANFDAALKEISANSKAIGGINKDVDNLGQFQIKAPAGGFKAGKNVHVETGADGYLKVRIGRK